MMSCVRSFDRDVLRAGVAAGLEALEAASGHLARLRTDGPGAAGLAEVGACLYRTGRATAAVGLAEIGQAVWEVEAALERLQASPRNLSRDELALLDEAVDLLTALLLSVNARTGAYSADDGRGCLDRLKAACA